MTNCHRRRHTYPQYKSHRLCDRKTWLYHVSFDSFVFCVFALWRRMSWPFSFRLVREVKIPYHSSSINFRHALKSTQRNETFVSVKRIHLVDNRLGFVNNLSFLDENEGEHATVDVDCLFCVGSQWRYFNFFGKEI